MQDQSTSKWDSDSIITFLYALTEVQIFVNIRKKRCALRIYYLVCILQPNPNGIDRIIVELSSRGRAISGYFGRDTLPMCWNYIRHNVQGKLVFLLFLYKSISPIQWPNKNVSEMTLSLWQHAQTTLFAWNEKWAVFSLYLFSYFRLLGSIRRCIWLSTFLEKLWNR